MAPQTSFDTSRQGSVTPFTVIEGPQAWSAADFKDVGEEQLLHLLSPTEVAELNAAVFHALSEGLSKELKDVLIDDVEHLLPTLGPVLSDLGREANSGRGFALIRGVPVHRYSREQQLAAFWIFGLHWGRAVPQNKAGHLMGHIKDIGSDPKDPNTRLYATREAQPWHNDGPADLVALLSLAAADEGGDSGWSSSVSVHNEILRRAPHLARLLAGNTWFFDRKGEVPDGKAPFFPIPVFNYHRGHLSVNYSDNYYHSSQRHAAVPRLTPQHHEAIALFNQLASSPELSLRLVLQPGDVQLLSNHTVLHYRGAFRDSPTDPARQRHLLRLWITPQDGQPLPEAYTEMQGGSVAVGKRGGIFVQGQQPHIPLQAQ